MLCVLKKQKKSRRNREPENKFVGRARRDKRINYLEDTEGKELPPFKLPENG
jgi:hypothetical protein